MKDLVNVPKIEEIEEIDSTEIEEIDAPEIEEIDSTEVRRTKVKVSVTEILLKLISEAPYLMDVQKEELLCDIKKILEKTTTSGRVDLKFEIRDIILASGEDGISKGGLVKALIMAHPKLAPVDPDGFMDVTIITDKIFMPLQPKNLNEWKIERLPNGNFRKIVKKFSVKS